MDVNVVIIHHDDPDGRAAAVIALTAVSDRRLPERFLHPRFRTLNPADDDPRTVVRLVGTGCEDPSSVGWHRTRVLEVDYKDAVDISYFVPGACVIIVDFSFKPDQMAKIVEAIGPEGEVIWIDHHATAAAYSYEFPGLRDFSDKGQSGAELTWQYFFPEVELPEWVRLLGDYDTFRLKEAGRSLLFYEGLKLHEQSPLKDCVWKSLWSAAPLGGNQWSSRPITVEEVIKEGRLATSYRDNYCEQMLRGYGYEIEFEGHKALVLNLYRFGSGQFGSRFSQYPICIAYIHDGSKFTVSLYSETVDVGALAKKHGGGGHRGASGFVCEQLPWACPGSCLG